MGLLGGELVGYRPAWLSAHYAQVALVVQAVDLDDHAVRRGVKRIGAG